jgi:hypothetical protein
MFTAKVWTPGEDTAPKVGGKVGTYTENEFPFLDMELSWSDNGTLKFGVHMKLNQQLKYLNTGSAHTPGCFKAIKTGVCYRLTKLTTVDEDSVDLKLDEIYPEHFDALNKANLLKDFEAPTLGVKTAELEAALKDKVGQATKKRRERDRKRAIYFKVGFCNYWRTLIHKTICEVKSRFPSLHGYEYQCRTTVSPTCVNFSKVTSTPSSTATSSPKTSRSSLATAGTNKRVSTPVTAAPRLWCIKQSVSR